MKLAYKAHQGQYDQSGVPYIFHPVHLAEQMDDEITTCIALLHDVLEDTSLTIEDLRQEFPEIVVETVLLLTHDPAVDYLDYVRKLCTSPLARKVKLADITHNTDETRLSVLWVMSIQMKHVYLVLPHLLNSWHTGEKNTPRQKKSYRFTKMAVKHKTSIPLSEPNIPSAL